jgi:4-amino-4-deoxy-L-arabinose transferase-like glycosyltransferase
MDRADRDRSGRPAPATAGTLDAGDQAPGTAGAGQAADTATGPAGGGPASRAESAPAEEVPAAQAGKATAGEATAGGAGTRRSRLRRAAGSIRRRLTGPAWPRRLTGAAWLRRPVTRQLTLLVFFLGAGVAVTLPLATYLTGSLPESRDTASYVWGFWWVAHQVTHLGNPWFTKYMAAPVGVDLGFHTLMPLPGLLFTPLTLAFGPSFSYNLMVTLLPGLLCYAMYRAARLWLRSATGAVAAGLFFGLSSMLTQQTWYHLNIALGALFLPLALEASVRLRRTPGRRQAIILGLVMGAAVLTDQESSVLAAIVVVLALVPWLLRRPSWARLWPVALAAVVGAVVASPQIVAMLQEIGQGGLTIKPQLLAVSYKQYGIGLPGMFTPTPRVANFGLGALAEPFLRGRDNEGMPMFGTVLTVLALGGLIASYRRRSAWLLAALWLGCAALALGTSLWIGKHQYLPLASMWNGVRVSDLMPYTWFVRIPGLSSFREADRLAILGLLPAALLAGAAVDWLRYHARPVLVLVLAAGVLEAGYAGNAKVGVMQTSYPAVDKAIAADHSKSVVLDLPFGLRGGIPVDGVPFFPQALVMATADGHPRSVGYSSRVPLPTINAINHHPFYADLILSQHQNPPKCPWWAGAAKAKGPCFEPPGVYPYDPLKVSEAQLDAAARDAARMHIRWAVVWKRNNSVTDFILPYLRETGFRFAYRTCGRDSVLVYERTTRPLGTPTKCPPLPRINGKVVTSAHN